MGLGGATDGMAGPARLSKCRFDKTSYLGKQGIRRFIETMVATALVIILIQSFVRWFFILGWIDSSAVTANFEGYSGNRNAFAFQLLACSVLLIAHMRVEFSSTSGLLGLRRDTFVTAVHGVILAGLIFSGSRAGIITGMILLAFAGVTGFAHRRFLLQSLIYCILIFVTFIWLLPWVALTLFETDPNLNFSVMSNISTELSNIERWETIRRGFEMWLDAPWLGAGLGVFFALSQHWLSQANVIHSTPVWFLAEFGLIGAAFLLGVLSWIVISIKRSGFKKPENRAVIMLLLIFSIFGLVHEIFYQRIFWLCLGICIAFPFQKNPELIKQNNFSQ